MAETGTRFDDEYNAAVDLIARNLAAGRADKPAFIDINGTHSYGDVERLSNKVANAMTGLGIQREQRVLMCMLDTVDFVAVFLGCIKAGIVPVPVNTRLTAKDYSFMLDDSRAAALVVSEPLYPLFEEDIDAHPSLEQVIVSGADSQGHKSLSDLIAAASDRFEPVRTRRDDMCFWLYTSGTTGMPKGAVHLHSHLIETANLYAKPILGIDENDVVYSAAKLFFAYGLGNGLTFPMAAGATTILHAGPPDAAAVVSILREKNPTIFYGVPTLYGMLLASGQLPKRGEHSLRLCTSAGEALPAELMRRWKETTGTDILDGIGTTEMLHIFLSNSADDIKPGTTGKPVPGYDLRLVDEDGNPVPAGEMGTLEVSGPTSAIMYWNQREKSRDTFRGPWTRTGDKYTVDADGYYTYAGRTDDMMKVGGIYVSPFEVETAILTHECVLEVAVVGQPDQDDLIKPKAYVVLNQGHTASDELTQALIEHAKAELAAFKRPRWIEFVEELPKTATGKIQRYKLRL